MNNIKKVIAVFALFFLASATGALAQSNPNNAPALKIISPGDNQTIYGDKIPVLMSTENFELKDFKTNTQPTQGQGHIHLWLDDANPTAQTAVKVIEDNYTFTNVIYGDHTLRAELVNNDHTSLNPPQVTTIRFNSVAAEPASPVVKNSFDKNTALVILVVVSLVIIAAWWYTKEDDGESEKQETKNTKPKTKRIVKRKKNRSVKK